MNARIFTADRLLVRTLAIVIGLANAAVSVAEDAGEFFAPNKLHQVEITLSAEEWSAMQPRGGRGFPGFPAGGAAPEPPPAAHDGKPREVHRNTFGFDLPWALGDVKLDEHTFAAVGLRFKGNGTILDAQRTIKKSFKIDLDRFGGKQTFGASKTNLLHCGVTDPSKCRETLGYAIYRAAGVPAPRTAFAEVRLQVPGKFERELLGVYTLVEAVDKLFLKSHFGAADGLLLKPEGVREFDLLNDDWPRQAKRYDPQRDAKPEEIARIQGLSRLIQRADDDEFRREIGGYLNIDGYLRFLAATSFIANSDSYYTGGHNYYVYLDSAGKFHFLPWDVDRAFANFFMLGTPAQQMNLNFAKPYAGAHKLTDRLLATPEIAARFQTLLRELAATAFDRERLQTELAAAEALVKEPLARELAAAAARKEASGPNMFGKPPELPEFLVARTQSLADQLAGKTKGHLPTGGGFDAPKVGEMLAGPMLGDLDTDQNKLLSKAEWLAGARKLFAACSKDDDEAANEKSLTDGLNALFPPPPPGPPGAPPNPGVGRFLAPPILTRADADKNKKLTLDELNLAAEKLWDEFDKRQTGVLDTPAFTELLNALFPPPNFGPPPTNRG